MFDQRFELEDRLPDIAVKKEQPRLELDLGKVQFRVEQRTCRIYVHERAAHQDARILPAVKVMSAGNEMQFMAEFTLCGSLKAFDNAFAIVALRLLRSDQNVGRGLYPTFESFQARKFKRLDPNSLPCRDAPTHHASGEDFHPGRGIHGRLGGEAAPHDLTSLQFSHWLSAVPVRNRCSVGVIGGSSTTAVRPLPRGDTAPVLEPASNRTNDGSQTYFSRPRFG